MPRIISKNASISGERNEHENNRANSLADTLARCECSRPRNNPKRDESFNGPFSHAFQNPTILGALQSGTNTIIGASEVVPTGGDWAGYPDYFVFTIPANTSVSSAFLEINKPNVWLWIGGSGYANPLSYSVNPSTGSLLAQLSLASIGAGTYGMYMDNHDQQSFTSIANYRLDFFVQPNVPEPGTISLLVVGLGLVGLRFCKITARKG